MHPQCHSVHQFPGAGLCCSRLSHHGVRVRAFCLGTCETSSLSLAVHSEVTGHFSLTRPATCLCPSAPLKFDRLCWSAGNSRIKPFRPFISKVAAHTFWPLPLPGSPTHGGRPSQPLTRKGAFSSERCREQVDTPSAGHWAGLGGASGRWNPVALAAPLPPSADPGPVLRLHFWLCCLPPGPPSP